MARATAEIERTYLHPLRTDFSRAQNTLPLSQIKFDMRNVGRVTPSEWFSAAISMARAMGMDDVPVKVDENPDQITYTLYFNDFAENARLSLGLDGLVIKPKAYKFSVLLGTTSPDEKMEDYYTAINAYCDSRAIACEVTYVINNQKREIHLAFDSNADYFATKQAIMPGGSIVAHLDLLTQQRQHEAFTPGMEETLKLDEKRGWPYTSAEVLRHPTLEKHG